MIGKRMKRTITILTAVSIVAAGAKGLVQSQKRSTTYIPMK
jgi:hypothetical protein